MAKPISSLVTDKLRSYIQHPALMVRELFGVEPDPWQEEVLEAFPHKQRIAMQASKGPGKTACLAWLAWNFLLTRPQPKIGAVSVSADNLADNFWAEMAYWQGKSPLLQSKFQWTKTRIFSKERPDTWFMAAKSWPKSADSEQLGNTLAGLHAPYNMFILDESGSIPEAVLASADAALSACIEGHIIQAGNPTSLTGALYLACKKQRDLWHVVEITSDPDSPSRSPRVSVQWAKEQIAAYGRDNPWVLVNVFGQFPPSSIDTLIGLDELRSATQRIYREADYGGSARILGVDVARQGDDSSIIFPRQGLVAFDPLQFRSIGGTEGAAHVARKLEDWEADAVFIDDTGGYGASWIDNLIRLGHSPIGIGFASRAIDAPRYANRRAEMAFQCVEWVKRGGRIPDIPELIQAMSQTTYTFQGDRFLIEPKDDIKKRLGYSPDHFDALMLTFAAPVTPKLKGFNIGRKRGGLEADYNPLAHAWNVANDRGNNERASWLPGQTPPYGS